MRYLIVASELRMATNAHGRQKWLHKPQETCLGCHGIGLSADALSIALDMAQARESDERIRASVAWA